MAYLKAKNIQHNYVQKLVVIVVERIISAGDNLELPKRLTQTLKTFFFANIHQGRTGFWSTSVSHKAIRDSSSALKQSPHPSTNVAHCRLTLVDRQILITLRQNP